MDIRMMGAVKAVGGLLGSFILYAVLSSIFSAQNLHTFSMIAIATPAAYGLAGLLEFVTGMPFFQIASKWDELAGWQRGILGLVIVVLAFVLIILGMSMFA